MSIDSAQPGASTTVRPIAPRWRRRLPRRFFAGTLLLYALVLGTYLLVLTPLHRAIPNWRSMLPLLSFAAFYVCAGLFLLILGRGHVSRWEVLRTIITTFVLTCVLCLASQAQTLHDAIDPGRTGLRRATEMIASAVRWSFSGQGQVARACEMIVKVGIEEVIKLLPVFILIARGRIRTAHGAMLCGVLSGLTFGIVEAISYGYLEYAGQSKPLTTYLTRFFVMAPLHGVWDALGGGLVFFLSGRWRSNSSRQPGAWAFVAAFLCAVAFHIAHNSLQAILGPKAQIITVFSLLAPLYLMARTARRRSEAMGQPQELPFIGDLHLLMISMATWFLATSVAFGWAMGLT